MSDLLGKIPVFIIGAGRSGTNMLRDLLVQRTEFATWPCDEINYIWRHGNRKFPTDQFTREMATEPIKRFIKKQFDWLRRQNPGAAVVEKTCANSLRCGFLHEIFPYARFIHIIRDGRDVAASASLRWNAILDIPYLLKKARFVPMSDLPFYAFDYFKARCYRLFSGKKRLSTWGPKFEGMESAFSENELAVGCAIQWRECVGASLTQLEELAPSQVLTLRYEAFTSNPVAELSKTFQFLGCDVPEAELESMSSGVSNKSVGKWKQQLTDAQIEKIHGVSGSLLEQLGYIDEGTV